MTRNCLGKRSDRTFMIELCWGFLCKSSWILGVIWLWLKKRYLYPGIKTLFWYMLHTLCPWSLHFEPQCFPSKTLGHENNVGLLVCLLCWKKNLDRPHKEAKTTGQSVTKTTTTTTTKKLKKTKEHAIDSNRGRDMNKKNTNKSEEKDKE